MRTRRSPQQNLPLRYALTESVHCTARCTLNHNRSIRTLGMQQLYMQSTRARTYSQTATVHGVRESSDTTLSNRAHSSCSPAFESRSQQLRIECRSPRAVCDVALGGLRTDWRSPRAVRDDWRVCQRSTAWRGRRPRGLSEKTARLQSPAARRATGEGGEGGGAAGVRWREQQRFGRRRRFGSRGGPRRCLPRPSCRPSPS